MCIRDSYQEEIRKEVVHMVPDGLNSRALAFAVAAGLPPQMAYTVSQTAKYTGLNKQTLYREHDAGRLAFVMPNGNTRGYRIKVDEVDRWMKEN